MSAEDDANLSASTGPATPVLTVNSDPDPDPDPDPESDPDPDTDDSTYRIVRESEFAEVREYDGSKGTVMVFHTCPACGIAIGQDIGRTLTDHLENDHGPGDFPPSASSTTP